MRYLQKPIGLDGALFLAAIPVIGFQLVNGIWLTQKESAIDIYAIYLIDFLFMVVVPLVSYLVVKVRYGSICNKLGFLSKYSERDILWKTVICIIVFLFALSFLPWLTWAMLWRFDWILAGNYGFLYSDTFPRQLLSKYLLIIYLALTASIIEEVYYRGILGYLFYRWFGEGQSANLYYVLISSVIFGLSHWEGGLSKIAYMFILGVIAAKLFLWTRSLIPLIVAHFVSDIIYL